MIKSIKVVQSSIINSVRVLLRLSFQRNSQYFYGRYFGTDHPFVLAIKNLLRPKRIIKKILYGQIMRAPFTLSISNSVKELPELTDEWQEYFKILKRDGIVFIPGYFKKRSEALNEYYKLNCQNFPSRDKYYRFTVGFNNPDVFNIAVDPMMLTVLAKYYGYQPYYRQFPGINCTHLGAKKDPEAIGFNDFWHYDTVNQMTAHILLNDISESDSCMFYAKGSHRTHRQYISKDDYYYSEEYMNNNFEIIPCVGKSGTLVIFDSNGIHRADLKPNTFRSHLHLNFTPGNDFLDEVKETQTGFNYNIEDETVKLKEYQVESLSKFLNLKKDKNLTPKN